MAERTTKHDTWRETAREAPNQRETPTENDVVAEDDPTCLPIEYDRRGIALPRRHKVGGIITPQ